MNTEYYLQQILGKLEDIEDKTEYIWQNTNSIDTQQGVLMIYNRDFYNAFHTESGDFLPTIQHQETTNSIFLVAIILATSLILTFIIRSLK